MLSYKLAQQISALYKDKTQDMFVGAKFETVNNHKKITTKYLNCQFNSWLC